MDKDNKIPAMKIIFKNVFYSVALQQKKQVFKRITIFKQTPLTGNERINLSRSATAVNSV